MINSPLPSWKQLLGKVNHDIQEKVFGESEDMVYTNSSAASLSLIFSSYKDIVKCNKINVFVPGYFCEETLNKIRENYIHFHYYEIEENFEPNWKKIKERNVENVDFFIFCHFFGRLQDINRAKVFCDLQNVILIEDCAHVLYPAKGYGKKGDFVLYSPHKVLSIPDGGILIRNKSRNKIVDTLFQDIKDRCSLTVGDMCIRWRTKKMFQKIIQIQKKVPYIDTAHFGKKENIIIHNQNISEYAFRIISTTSYKDLKKMAYLRRCNLQLMNYLVKQIDNRIIEIMTLDVECPYVMIFSLEDIYNKRKFIKSLNSVGLEPQYWPDLPEEIKNKKGFQIEKNKSKNMVVLPVHQDIKPQKIAKLVREVRLKKEQISLQWLEDSEEGKKAYNHAIEKIDFSNIPQDWDYGSIKHTVEHWQIERALVRNQEYGVIGTIQILKKQKSGITIAVRINRGPLLISNYDSTENKLIILELIRKKIPRPIPIICAPNIDFSPENLVLITKYKWRQWNVYGYSSGVIDLQEGEDIIRKRLDSKWRNQLVSAEKRMLNIRTDIMRFEEILDLYEQSQTEKKYVGVPRKILQGLLNLEKTPLRVMYLVDKEEAIIAFDIFYITDNFGVYLVGWNSTEGRKLYSNNLLLYHAAVQFKEEGIRWLDLGGIDYIETEENARFKDGMRPKHYQLLGEFIKF